MTTQILLLGACVYLAGLAVVTYFTRATRRRFLGALAGGLAVAVVGVLAHRLAGDAAVRVARAGGVPRRGDSAWLYSIDRP